MSEREDAEGSEDENWLERLPPEEGLGIVLSTLMPSVADFWELSLAQNKIPCAVCGELSEFRDIEGTARHPGMSCASPDLWRRRGRQAGSE